MHATVLELFELHAASVFDASCHLDDLTKGLNWAVDVPNGLLSFGSQHQWQIQILGTQSEVSQTWRWAWADPASISAPHLLAAGLALRAFGEERDIPELKEAIMPLGVLDGHKAATLAFSVCEADAYFACSYAGGLLFVLVKDSRFPRCTVEQVQRIATLFPRAIASISISDHRLAFAGYVDQCGIAFDEDDDHIYILHGDTIILTATFDSLNRLTAIEANLKQSIAARTETWDQMQLRCLLGW